MSNDKQAERFARAAVMADVKGSTDIDPADVVQPEESEQIKTRVLFPDDEAKPKAKRKRRKKKTATE